MPVFAEIGPLIMNKEIETKVMTMLEKSECVTTSKMDSMNFSLIKDVKNYQTCLPLECQIKIDQNFLSLHVSTDGDKKHFNEEIFRFPLGLSYPYIKICRMTNNVYEIYFDKGQMIRMMAENNLTRDIIAVSLKMLCGQKILDHKFLDSEEKKLETPQKSSEQEPKTTDVEESKRPNDHEKPNFEATHHHDQENHIKTQKDEENSINQQAHATKHQDDPNNQKTPHPIDTAKPPQTLQKSPQITDTAQTTLLATPKPYQDIPKAQNIVETLKTSNKEENHTKMTMFETPERVKERDSGFLQSENFKALQTRVEQQERDIEQLVRESEVMKREKHQFLDEIAMFKREKEQLSTEVFNAKRNYMEALRENEQSKTKLEKFITEKNFLLQDLDLYKTQINDNEETIAAFELKIKGLTNLHEESMAEQGRKFDSELRKTENEKINEFEKEVVSLKNEIRILNDQIVMKLGTIRELSQSNEDLENKVNYLMKKNESLKYETSKNYQNIERNNNEDMDIEKLQMQVVSYEKTIKE